MKSLKQDLEDRGLSYQNSNEDIFKLLDKWWVNFFCWFDPTADSLHLWNFIWFMVSVHIMRRWNKFTALTGWATWMVWDPGWKDSERTFLSMEDLDKNQQSISSQISGIANNLKKFTSEDFKFDFVNNKDFYTDMGYLDFLREVWKYITVNVMMSKDTVKKRIEDPNKSISYTEFSYMLLQGYDFVRLFSDDDVKLQIWWQDQWGNLVTWTELIRKKYDKDSYVITWPLIVDSSGKKFGKSEGNALWLDKNKTSPYELYQYFVNTSDEDLERYLKMLTLIETEEIENVVKKHMSSPEKREWQKLLAYKVVEIIHGGKDAKTSEKISELLFGSDDKMKIVETLWDDELNNFYDEIGGFKYTWENLFETIVKSDLANSNGEARNAVQSGAIYINEEKLTDFNYNFENSFINDRVLLLRKWKKNLKLIIKK